MSDHIKAIGAIICIKQMKELENKLLFPILNVLP